MTEKYKVIPLEKERKKRILSTDKIVIDKGPKRGTNQPSLKEVLSQRKQTPILEKPTKRKDITPPDKNTKPKEKRHHLDNMSDSEEQQEGATGPDVMTDNTDREQQRKREMVEMQEAITKAVTSSLKATWNASLNEIKEDISEMKKDIKTLMDSKDLVQRKEQELKLIIEGHTYILTKYHSVLHENTQIKNRIAKIEDKFLENNIVIHGIAEERGEGDEGRQEKIYHAMATTVKSQNPMFRLQAAKRAGIKYTRRIGPPNKNSYRPRPISISFNRTEDAKILLQNKKELPDGVYVNREFSEETEKTRRLLRPIWKAAQDMPKYQGRCRLDGGTLILHGKRYEKENIHQLPDELSGFHISSKTNPTTFGFFGELSPFSNFHQSWFTLKGCEYSCMEQFIQREKAVLFRDYETADEIMSAGSALECKRLARNIRNYDHGHWNDHCVELCMPGIICKFSQNERLKTMLLSTYPKKLVECSRDSNWGTGIPLQDRNCLQADRWKGQGHLGRMLMDYREVIKNPRPLTSTLPTMDVETDAINSHNNAKGTESMEQ